jgi:hypothetical protein
MFEGLANVYFFSSTRLNPKPLLLVDVLSPNTFCDYFLFSGGRMFLIEVCESKANAFYSGILIWLEVGE